MRRLLIVAACIAALAWLIYFGREPAKQGIERLKLFSANTEQAIGAAQDAVILWQHTVDEMDVLKTQNKAILAQLKKSNNNILLLEESLLELKQAALASKSEIDSLKALLKVEPPADFEECVEQLGVAHEVIGSQDGKIQVLTAINTEQGLIISEKDVIISLKDEQVELYEAIVRQYKIRMGIVTTLSVLGWIVILL